MLFGRYFPRRRHTTALEVPTPELIERTGFEAKELRDSLIVPVDDPESPSGYRLVLADMEIVDREAFNLAGINLMIGNPDEIGAIWQAYQEQQPISQLAFADSNSGMPAAECRRSQTFSAQIIKTLARLATDAAEQGAKEVFIGYPAADDFEFLGSASRFRGQVDSNLGSAIARCLPAGEVFRAVLAGDAGNESGGVRRLIIGCVRELNRPVVYLSWDDGSQSKSAAREPGRVDAPTVLNAGKAQVLMAFPGSLQPANPEKIAARTIVLVDDDIRYLTIVGSILRRRGWQVHEALCAATGLTLIDQIGSKVDLVIADIRMPEMDGIEFLSQLRRKHSDLPVLMLTSDRLESAEIRAVKTGCNGFVLKQKELNILLAWVCRLLEQPYLPAEPVDFEHSSIQ